MIETYSWLTNTWENTGHKTLKKYIKQRNHYRDEPLKIRNTNQDDFDNVFIYYYDELGHMYILRMPEEEYNKEWYGEGLYKKHSYYMDKRKSVKLKELREAIEEIQAWLSNHCECTDNKQCNYCYGKQVLDELEHKLRIEE